MRMELNGEWQGKGYAPDGRELDFVGHVPGCVHGDLLRAGIIENPFWRDNAEKCRWIEDWNWVYTRTFQADAAWKDAVFSFEGLDTYCKVYCNGVEIGSADDMFIRHEFPAKGLKSGENTLQVVFFSPIAMTNGLPKRSAAFTSERVYTRRIQCTYFWDWVDRFVTMGIYRPVTLNRTEHREISDVRVETRNVDDFGALLFCHVAFKGEGTEAFCGLELKNPQGKTVYKKRRRIVEDAISEMIDVDAPQLWWPNGYGEQPLYRMTAWVEKDGIRLHEKTVTVGIRTARILQKRDMPDTESYALCEKLKQSPHVSGKNAVWDRNEPDEYSGFTLIVNNTPIFCKGANWVPCEPFPSEETPEKIRRLLTLARDAHANMIRVWGGGIFEQDAFYDICDELGLMVTQDFLMACGNYPEWDDGFLAHLRQEARYAALRLRNHACLMWWTGDNENAMRGDEDMEDYTGRRSALRAIAPVLEELDPNRPFLPSSPYGGRPYGSVTRGTTHNTNYIGEWFSYIRFHDMQDYRAYFDGYLSRFCAEEPIMGMTSPSSLRRFMTEEDIYGDDESMHRFHTKNNPAEAFKVFQIYDYLCAISDKLLGLPKCAHDKVLKREYVQYEWIRVTMELYRRRKWFSSGMVYWMLNDCWPANGWAILDYYARPKAGWYGFKRAAQPVIASIDEESGEYCLYVCADGMRAYAGRARLFVQDFRKTEPIAEVCAEFAVGANERKIVLRGKLPKAENGQLLLAEIAGEGFSDRTWFFESRPQDCGFVGDMPEVVSVTENAITLRAKSYIHAVSLDGECFFEDNFFSMLPNEERTIAYRREGEGAMYIRALDSASDDMIIEFEGGK